MIFLSIAFVIIACIAGFLVNKYLDNTHQLNTTPPVAVDTSVADNEQFKKFDTRLNTTWETISSIKTELESIKLQISLRKM